MPGIHRDSLSQLWNIYQALSPLGVQLQSASLQMLLAVRPLYTCGQLTYAGAGIYWRVVIPKEDHLRKNLQAYRKDPAAEYLQYILVSIAQGSLAANLP